MRKDPLWTPKPEETQASRLVEFMRFLGKTEGMNFPDYESLYQWSIRDRENFWSRVWDFSKILAQAKGTGVLLHGEQMPGAQWFPDARLNYAENLLKFCHQDDDKVALIFWGEDKVQRKISRAELLHDVTRVASALKDMGIKPGDRVAGYLPNLPETVIAMLASASLGATWSSASPDFGVQGVLDRFGQIQPKVFLTANGYWYNGKEVDCLEKVAALIPQMPSVEKVIVISYTRSEFSLEKIPRAVRYEDFLKSGTEEDMVFAQLPFSHPLFIMYSSGTTGVPKCIVHGAGGTLLQHLKEHQLHGDLKEGDRFFYFTTCGWMMWNWLVSGLASGATLLLYDGSPFLRNGDILFDYAQAEDVTHFGTSAKFLDACAKAQVEPKRTHKLLSLRVLFSTGSPLAPEGFDYVYEKIKSDLNLASISGGTDILSCFVLGSPLLPVWRSEIQCRGLGMAVEVFNDEGHAVQGEKGELVCTKAFPSMPIGFWNDPDGRKYREAYFAKYPNIWCHGDYVELTEHGGLIVHGRSDAVLNPGGVRIGTAEIYRQVERLPEIIESIVVGQDWQSDVRVILFVKLREGLQLDSALADKIKKVIRENTTPRHVPAKILQVKDIPRTKSNKIVELAVREMIHGRPVKNIEALANPEALAEFKDRVELRS